MPLSVLSEPLRLCWSASLRRINGDGSLNVRKVGSNSMSWSGPLEVGISRKRKSCIYTSRLKSLRRYPDILPRINKRQYLRLRVVLSYGRIRKMGVFVCLADLLSDLQRLPKTKRKRSVRVRVHERVRVEQIRSETKRERLSCE